MPSGPSGALHTGGGWVADVWLYASARSPARPRRRPRAPQPGPPSPLQRARHWWQWGFCSIRTFPSACRRRVAPLMLQFPPFGGEVAVRGGVTPILQTTSVKNAENRLFWRNGSALWRNRRVSIRHALGLTHTGNIHVRPIPKDPQRVPSCCKGSVRALTSQHPTCPHNPSKPPPQRKALIKGSGSPVKAVTSLDNGRKWRVDAGRTLELLR